jgi:hypothetical protein
MSDERGAVSDERREMGDERGTMSAGRDCRPPTACPGETMLTADSLQLTAYGFGRMQRWKQAGAVSRCRFLTRWCGLFAVTPVYYHDNSRSTRKTDLTLSLAGR